MSNTKSDDILRDRYFSNEIFKIGDLVEDTNTGELVKILDRGSNYITVATSDTVKKKWLYEVKEVTVPIVDATPVTVIENKDFELIESGQIRLFGYDTKNFNIELSEFIVEQFLEFDDLYSKHQIIKCLDAAFEDISSDRKYELLERVNKFYNKQELESPIIVEVMKNDTERTRIAEILATLADIQPSKSNSKTVTDSITSLREKYQTRREWEVLMPFLKMAQSSGLPGAVQNLPYGIAIPTPKNESYLDEIAIQAMFENFELLVEDLDLDDIATAFDEADYSETMLSEVLSIEARNKMAIKLKQHAPQLEIRRDRALSRSATTGVLMQRARRLAEVMVKRRMFHKSAVDMSRQEKERFESGANGRQALIAKLASRLVGKVRMLQSARMHHTATPASHTHDHATSAIHQSATKSGAS